jgi:hypothetical protein
MQLRPPPASAPYPWKCCCKNGRHRLTEHAGLQKLPLENSPLGDVKWLLHPNPPAAHLLKRLHYSCHPHFSFHPHVPVLTHHWNRRQRRLQHERAQTWNEQPEPPLELELELELKRVAAPHWTTKRLQGVQGCEASAPQKLLLQQALKQVLEQRWR